MHQLLLHTRYFFLMLMFFLIHIQAKTQLTYNELSVQYDSPWTFKKLQLIPIRFKGAGKAGVNENNALFNEPVVSFSDALRQRKITVKEMSAEGGPDVSTLMIKNRSNVNIMITSGEMVQGGKLDRAFGETVIIPKKKRKNYVPVFCVEKG